MKFFILLSVVAVATCTPVAQDESVVRLFLGNIVNCVNGDLGMCLKEQALKSTERLRSLRQINLYEGVALINNGPKEAKSLELATEPEARKRQVTDKLWESATDLLKNSDLELSYDPTDDETEASRAIDSAEGRGKKKEMKKKIKMLLPLVILAKAKAIALVVISLVVIAYSIAKIAFLLKIAFIAKIIALLKHLLHKKHEEEHGWIPHHEEHHAPTGWESGWSRSRNEANNLAYSAYAQ